MTQNHSYADVEIRIQEIQDKGYPVDITLNNEQEFPRGYLRPEFLPWVGGASPAEDGERLFDWLFEDDQLKKAWAEVQGQQAQRRVRLRVDAAAPELHAIPWELLRERSNGSVALDLAAASATPFSRYLAGKWQPGGPILKRPIKMLVVIANPSNLAKFDLAEVDAAAEWATLEQVTAGLDVELVRLAEPCTLVGLEAELKKGYHILHFVGHGSYSERQGMAALYMADEQNQVALAKGTDLAEMLGRQLADSDPAEEDQLRLVCLFSCQTATRSPADAFRGLAPQLVQAGVPAVVAMQDLVPVATAREFSRVFYQRLLHHGQVDLASNEARSALLTEKASDAYVPVLFMRLRDGRLLGQRGQIASDKPESFWPYLLTQIERGRMIPFLGPRVNPGLLPSPAWVARQLAKRSRYPLADRDNLARVAQFMAISDPDWPREETIRVMRRGLFTSLLGRSPTKEEMRRYREANLTETAAGLKWAERVLDSQENQLHHLLAELPLPLYITTNFDSFMVEALKHRGLDARRIGLRWDQIEAGTPQYTLRDVLGLRSGQRALDPEQPVVLHLNGYDDDPEQRRHLVLSVDDYLSHFVRLARDHDKVLPAEIRTHLTQSSFLFMGYSLHDWEFRVLLQGLVKAIKRPRKTNVGVQLEVDPDLDHDMVMDFFRRYLAQFNVEIYWGTPRQFVTELHHEWQENNGGLSLDEAEDWAVEDW